MHDINEIDVIRYLLTKDAGSADLAAKLINEIADSLGLEWSIHEEDGEAESLDADSDALWVVSTHTLMLGEHRIAEWTRCGVGSWGGNGDTNLTAPDEWDVGEDTNGGDTVPERVQWLLDVLEMEDAYPDVPAPTPADERIEPDADGEYCIYWQTVGDDPHVVGRYATADEAQAVAEAMARKLHSVHRGQLLCGYEVRHFEDGEWRPLDAD